VHEIVAGVVFRWEGAENVMNAEWNGLLAGWRGELGCGNVEPVEVCFGEDFGNIF
jgi:hypothetical protein